MGSTSMPVNRDEGTRPFEGTKVTVPAKERTVFNPASRHRADSLRIGVIDQYDGDDRD